MIGFIRLLSVNLRRNALLIIYKSFIRAHLDYDDILYDKPNNINLQNGMEKVQSRACLPITGRIQGTSRERLYNELGLHSLANRRWCNKPLFLSRFLFSKKISTKIIVNLYYKTNSNEDKILQKKLFPYCMKKRNKLIWN